MRCLFFRRHKYRTPEVRAFALEGEGDILVGSVIEFGAGEFSSRGQKVDDVDFSKTTEDWSGLSWDNEIE